MAFKKDFGSPFSEYTAGTNSGATASHAAATGKRHYITDVTFWSDTDTIITLLAGTAGATVVWEGKLDVSVEGFNKTVRFDTPIIGDISVKVEAKVATSTTDCGVTMNGYTV